MSLLGRFLGVRAPQPPRTTDRAVAFTLCAETFIRRDWESALAQATALGVEHKSLQILQIMLLSLQRIPVSMANPDYKLVWQDAVDSIPGTRGFDAVLLGVTLGQVTLDQALSTAKDDRERCKAYYYAGAQLLNQGRLEEAAGVLASA